MSHDCCAYVVPYPFVSPVHVRVHNYQDFNSVDDRCKVDKHVYKCGGNDESLRKMRLGVRSIRVHCGLDLSLALDVRFATVLLLSSRTFYSRSS